MRYKRQATDGGGNRFWHTNKSLCLSGKETPRLFLPLFPRNQASRRGGRGGGRGRGRKRSHRLDDSMSADLRNQSGDSDVTARKLSQSGSTAHIWWMEAALQVLEGKLQKAEENITFYLRKHALFTCTMPHQCSRRK